jgi:pimeloyl-ACP methyl ester carboxylesterase
MLALLLALWPLLHLATLVVPPTSGAPATPVRLDQECAASLSTRLTQRDATPVRVLGCEAIGRGRAVVALGDPATSPNVVVLVPGADTDLATLDDPDRPDRRPLGWARALSAAAGPDTAVVLWVGYETPQGLGRDAATGRLARAAVPALIRQVTALRDRPVGPPHLTVVGHSYGAVVVTLAASRLMADELVLVGSPGARAQDVTALGTDARVFAGQSPDDWIRVLPHVRVGDLGHGTDPTDVAFGAARLPADDVVGHDGYFRSGTSSLAAVVRVTNGQHRTSGP